MKRNGTGGSAPYPAAVPEAHSVEQGATVCDSDCLALLPRLPNRRERALYRFGLRRATPVVAQTQSQRDLLYREFGVHSVVIRSCSATPEHTVCAGEGTSVADPVRILWVGRFNKVKRLEMFLDVAKA